MRERGDLAVLHEPFMYHHYLTQTERLFPDFKPEPGHPQTYADIRAMILGRAEAGQVFFKDMAYYVSDRLPGDADFAAAMSHAFLVRDPAESILSYHRRDPGFTSTELGIAAQKALHDALRGLGHDPLVITADQLRADPERTLGRYWAHVGLPFVAEAFCWDSAVPEGWKSVEEWHGRALKSGKIKPPEAKGNPRADVAQLGPPFTEYDRTHRPAYEALREIAERQAHQK